MTSPAKAPAASPPSAVREFLETEDLALLEKPLVFERDEAFNSYLCCLGVCSCVGSLGVSLLCPIQTCCPSQLFDHFSLKVGSDSSWSSSRSPSPHPSKPLLIILCTHPRASHGRHAKHPAAVQGRSSAEQRRQRLLLPHRHLCQDSASGEDPGEVPRTLALGQARSCGARKQRGSSGRPTSFHLASLVLVAWCVLAQDVELATNWLMSMFGVQLVSAHTGPAVPRTRASEVQGGVCHGQGQAAACVIIQAAGTQPRCAPSSSRLFAGQRADGGHGRHLSRDPGRLSERSGPGPRGHPPCCQAASPNGDSGSRAAARDGARQQGRAGAAGAAAAAAGAAGPAGRAGTGRTLGCGCSAGLGRAWKQRLYGKVGASCSVACTPTSQALGACFPSSAPGPLGAPTAPSSAGSCLLLYHMPCLALPLKLTVR